MTINLLAYINHENVFYFLSKLIFSSRLGMSELFNVYPAPAEQLVVFYLTI